VESRSERLTDSPASRGYARHVQSPETRYAARPDGISIAHQVFGAGPIDLLVSPGLASHLDMAWTDPDLTRLWRRLASFARVITYDKPGTGLSDPIMHVPTLEERSEDIRIVLEAVGSERTALLGFSEGGPACLLFAATDPERVESLVLYGAVACANPGEEELDDPGRVAAQQRFDSAHRDLEASWGQGKIIDYYAPSVANRLQRSAFASFERAAASPALARRMIAALRRIDVRGALDAVRVPTLILHHSEDIVPVFQARMLADGIPGAGLKILPGRDHMFWVSDFEESVGEIERFLAGSGGAASPERALATVLFTDIVDSTARASELGDSAWRQVLERHERIVREQVANHRGRVVKSLGDGTLATFDGPARAIRCAEAIRDALGDVDIPIRAGIHTGECEMIGDDVGGLAVHIGARVGSLADPGEILVSSTVADLVVGSGLRFSERGEHGLKGVPGSWRLLAVGDPVERRREPRAVASMARDMRLADRVTVGLARRAPRVMRAASELGRRSVRRRG
jgi:class 3 adenylate cyclase/pimeloyl-ACP methyl ester carboxylesterase